MNQLSYALNFYQAVSDRIRAEVTDIDEQTLADTVEGLTDLHEILAAIVRSALIDEALAEGLRNRMKQMQARLIRFDERAEKQRCIARDVMIEADIKKITAPDFTVSIRSGTPHVAVTDEAGIPADYWRQQAPKLDRQAVLSALKRGAQIPGVELSNPQPVLSVRSN
jgi:Siphovirus Gp157